MDQKVLIKVEVPMFSSYVFIHVDEKNRQMVLQDPGAKNYIYWLGKPVVVRESDRSFQYTK